MQCLLASPVCRKRKTKKLKLEKLYPHIDFKKKQIIDHENLCYFRWIDDPMNDNKNQAYVKAKLESDKYFKFRSKTFMKIHREATFLRKHHNMTTSIVKKQDKLIKKYLLHQ